MGRHSRKEIDKLRTMVWFEHVREDLGVDKVSKMNDAFNLRPDRHTKEPLNMHWYKYRSGARMPTIGSRAAIERRCPGSRQVFEVGPGGVLLWDALDAPHAKLWKVIDITFPEYKEQRRIGMGLMQYKQFFNKLLLPADYHHGLDYIAHAKGLQRNAVQMAFSKGEISITPSIVASVIAYWRLSSLVMFDMYHADYLLCGVILALKNGEIFSSAMDKLILGYLENYLKEEYSEG